MTERVAGFGYSQEFKRSLDLFSRLTIAFSFISATNGFHDGKGALHV